MLPQKIGSLLKLIQAPFSPFHACPGRVCDIWLLSQATKVTGLVLLLSEIKGWGGGEGWGTLEFFSKESVGPPFHFV